MTTAVTVRKIHPWKGTKGPSRDDALYIPSISDQIPPVTPGRDRINYDHDTPDWRWREADRIYQGISNPDEYQPGRNADKILVQHLLPFLWHYRMTARSENGSVKVKAKYPELWWANRIMKENEDLAFFFQAAAIAGAPIEEVADRLMMVPEQIWWYEKVFFDVRPFLCKPEWIMLRVLQPSLHRFGRLHTKDFLWKTLAWNGDVSWEQLLEMLNPGGKLAGDTHAHITDMLDRKTLEDTLLAVFSRIPNSYNENFIVEQYLKMLEIERSTGHVRGERQKDNNLRVLMNTIQSSFHMASVDTKFDGVETRAHHELVNIYQERTQLAADVERTRLGDAK